MFNHQIKVFLTISIFSFGASAEVNFEPRVTLGAIDYELSLFEPGEAPNITDGVNIDISNRTPSIGLSDTMSAVGMGGTISSGSLFADAYFQTSISGELQRSGDVRGAVRGAQDIDLERDDYAVSFGKSFGSLVFGLGYKRSETEFSQGFDLLEGEGLTAGNLSSTFTLDGPFISAAYGWGIGKGSLSIKVAVADLDGQWQINQIAVDPGNRSDLETNLAGEATGVTFGLAWKAPISESWFYKISADYYEYGFNVTGSGSRAFTNAQGLETVVPGVTDPIEVRIDEEVFSLNLAVSYQF